MITNNRRATEEDVNYFLNFLANNLAYIPYKKKLKTDIWPMQQILKPGPKISQLINGVIYYGEDNLFWKDMNAKWLKEIASDPSLAFQQKSIDTIIKELI